jgi:hypothetical protein
MQRCEAFMVSIWVEAWGTISQCLKLKRVAAAVEQQNMHEGWKQQHLTREFMMAAAQQLG